MAVTALQAGTAVLALRRGRRDYADGVWGPGLAAVALTGAVAGNGDPVRRWVLAGATAAWAARLERLMLTRLRDHDEEDPRYAKMLGDGGFSLAVRRVFLVQGLVMWFVSLPVQVGAVTGTRWSWLVGIGVVVWVVGLLFESVGDAQLTAYKADPDRKPVMDRGLWGWTRHPNYFGDFAVWWGIWLVGGLAGGFLPALTIVSPAAMAFFLIFASGAKLLEQTMMKRPGYPEYAERTPMFFPWPPKKRIS